MYKLYYIISPSTNGIYVGITNNIYNRWRSHLWSVKNKGRHKLYDSMRKYKDFCIVEVGNFNTREECCIAEVNHIRYMQENNIKIYNHTTGGEVGFSKEIIDVDSWKEKLRLARRGRKPAKGMTHSEENKEYFSRCGIKRWDIYGRYPAEVIDFPFKESHEKFGISKTHYYRLKRAKSNDLS